MSTQLRTVKFEITKLLSEEDKARILNTMRDSQIVFSKFAELGNTHKSTSYSAMHKYGYELCKQLCPDFNTGLLQYAGKLALWNLKGWNKRNKTKKWQYQGNKKRMSYSLSPCTLSQRGSLYTFSANGGGRIRVLLELPQWFTKKYPSHKLQAGTVLFKKGLYYLCLNYQVEFNPSTSLIDKHVVGIDRGLYHAVATSDGFLYSSSQIRAVERRYLHNRKTLQAKGTRSAKRRLKQMSGREKRFKANVDHYLSAYLSRQKNVSCYVLEDLKKISQVPKKGRMSTNPAKVYRSKRYNKWLHSWSPYRFETFLRYKCEACGIDVVTVNPAYTSQICSMCGHIEKSARNKNHYLCPVCGHHEHSDLNAAKNIRDRYCKHLPTPVSGTGRFQASVCIE